MSHKMLAYMYIHTHTLTLPNAKEHILTVCMIPTIYRSTYVQCTYIYVQYTVPTVHLLPPVSCCSQFVSGSVHWWSDQTSERPVRSGRQSTRCCVCWRHSVDWRSTRDLHSYRSQSLCVLQVPTYVYVYNTQSLNNTHDPIHNCY